MTRVREFTAFALEAGGYRVLAARRGNGLALLGAHPVVVLLFTDVVLAGALNGRRLAEEARRVRPDLLVLFTTGYTRNAIIHHGRLDPGTHLLGKPYSFDDLAAYIRRLLDGTI